MLPLTDYVTSNRSMLPLTDFCWCCFATCVQVFALLLPDLCSTLLALIGLDCPCLHLVKILRFIRWRGHPILRCSFCSLHICSAVCTPYTVFERLAAQHVAIFLPRRACDRVCVASTAWWWYHPVVRRARTSNWTGAGGGGRKSKFSGLGAKLEPPPPQMADVPLFFFKKSLPPPLPSSPLPHQYQPSNNSSTVQRPAPSSPL